MMEVVLSRMPGGAVSLVPAICPQAAPREAEARANAKTSRRATLLPQVVVTICSSLRKGPEMDSMKKSASDEVTVQPNRLPSRCPVLDGAGEGVRERGGQALGDPLEIRA